MDDLVGDVKFLAKQMGVECPPLSPGHEDKFKIWSRQECGLMDCFEIFSGLILTSNGSYADKVSFLFRIFDLN